MARNAVSSRVKVRRRLKMPFGLGKRQRDMEKEGRGVVYELKTMLKTHIIEIYRVSQIQTHRGNP